MSIANKSPRSSINGASSSTANNQMSASMVAKSPKPVRQERNNNFKVRMYDKLLL